MKENDLNNKMSKDYIKSALSFYNINDKMYEENCIKTISIIKENEILRNKIWEIYNILYNNIEDKIAELWTLHDISDLFGTDFVPFVTNILLLLGFANHKENIKKYKFSKNQICIHKQRVKECLTKDIYDRKYENIRISQMLWGTYFINCKLIEVGRLQYEYCENYIKIHIPAGNKLDFGEVEKSIKDSKKKIKKYYGKNDMSYYCNSWLLSKQIRLMLKDNSNIVKFQTLFEIEEGESCLKDILNFVYKINECLDYNLLPEKSSLQKSIKQYLLLGNDVKLGKGKLILEKCF